MNYTFLLIIRRFLDTCFFLQQFVKSVKIQDETSVIILMIVH